MVAFVMATFKFGSCLFDLDSRQLLRDGQPVHLSPKAFELLKVLVTEQDRAVSKAELHERIWAGTFVSDDSLTRLVAETRAAIGDHAGRSGYIRTVHAFGYAFEARTTKSANSARSDEPVHWLVIDRRAVKLVPGDNVIGRDPDAQIVLDSVRVSRRHAVIRVEAASVTLEDLGSRNGTALKGARIDGLVELADGDEITIGGLVLTFHADTGSVETADDLPDDRLNQKNVG